MATLTEALAPDWAASTDHRTALTEYRHTDGRYFVVDDLTNVQLLPPPTLIVEALAADTSPAGLLVFEFSRDGDQLSVKVVHPSTEEASDGP